MNSIVKSVLIVAALCVMASPALGDMRIRIADGLGSTNGGVFGISSVSGYDFVPTIDGDPFDTFCVETSETLSIGSTYSVRLSTAAIYNNGGALNSDQLSPESAYLYSLWLGFDGGIDQNTVNADAVQKAIWYYEGEANGEKNWLADRAYDAVTEGSGSENNDSWYDAYGYTIGNVRVMNLFAEGHAGEYDYRHQDLLVQVPVPGAALLGLLGFSLIGWIKRRFA